MINYINRLSSNELVEENFESLINGRDSFGGDFTRNILSQLVSSKDNSIINFGYIIKDVIRKKDLNKYKQLISSKKMFDSIVKENMPSLKNTYSVSGQFKEFEKILLF